MRNVTIARTSGPALPTVDRTLQTGRVIRAALVIACLLAAPAARAHPEIEQALARLNAQIASQPDEAALYVERGELYARHAEWIAAEANYLRAAELAPADPRLARARGVLALSTQEPATALTFLDAALARQPHDAEALVWRSRAHAALRSPARALADLEAALALIAEPTPELFLERAALLPPADAIRSLDDALARLGPVIALHLRAAALEEQLGRIDAAAARFRLLAAQSERQEPWLKRRGDLLARAGRTAEARAAYAEALAALAALPDWLRASPHAAQLAAELASLAAPST